MPRSLTIYRVDKQVHQRMARSGEGARICGGRWNPAGLPAIYCGQSLALAVLEVLVHAITPQERADPRLWFSITLPFSGIPTVRPSALPRGWDDPFIIHPATIAFGEEWLRSNESLALRVPSALLPGEWNLILNPAHPKFFRSIRWSKGSPLRTDPRLIAR